MARAVEGSAPTRLPEWGGNEDLAGQAWEVLMAQKKNSLVANINRRKRAGTSRPKSRSKVSSKSYKNMERGWGKTARKKTAAKKTTAKKSPARKRSTRKSPARKSH
jgi:hypothetical protein